jgi:hypothetical protein
VRKIISILVALGMILGLSVMAVPTAGATTCDADVSLSSACASATGVVYTITFEATKTLLAGNDKLSFEFGAGTTFGTFVLTDVTVNDGGGAVDVPLANIAKSGAHLEFLIPAGVFIDAGDTVTVVIKKVVNPAVDGDYTMSLDYEFACCGPEDFGCGEYTITPKYSEYDFVWDSNPTYPGIAVGFVPPFKACGQENFAGYNIGAMPGGKWLNYFDLLLMPTLVGCFGPCTDNVTVTLNLTAAPAGSNVTLDLDGTVVNLVPTTKIPQPQIVVGSYAIGANTTVNWSNAIHFDTVGDYQICVKAWCTVVTECPTCLNETQAVAEECFDIHVYQWKTAEKINLYRKWNLISLPLVPLEEDIPVEDVLAALPNASTLIKGIYYYDCVTGDWEVFGNGQTSLATLEDGKSYWVKVDYVLGSATKGPGLPVGGLWVWGTPKPVPPSSPSAYPVCTGWNMVGLTGYTLGGFSGLPTTTQGNYLWNWWSAGVPQYGAIFGWTTTSQTWWSVLPAQAGVLPSLQTGEGYWISFGHDGMIYPP